MELSGDMNNLIMLFVPPVTGVIQSGVQKQGGPENPKARRHTARFF